MVDGDIKDRRIPLNIIISWKQTVEISVWLLWLIKCLF